MSVVFFVKLVSLSLRGASSESFAAKTQSRDGSQRNAGVIPLCFRIDNFVNIVFEMFADWNLCLQNRDSSLSNRSYFIYCNDKGFMDSDKDIGGQFFLESLHAQPGDHRSGSRQ